MKSNLRSVVLALSLSVATMAVQAASVSVYEQALNSNWNTYNVFNAGVAGITLFAVTNNDESSSTGVNSVRAGWGAVRATRDEWNGQGPYGPLTLSFNYTEVKYVAGGSSEEDTAYGSAYRLGSFEDVFGDTTDRFVHIYWFATDLEAWDLGAIEAGESSVGQFLFGYDPASKAALFDDKGNVIARQLAVSNPNSTVPEPASLALLGLGLAGLRCSRRKKA